MQETCNPDKCKLFQLLGGNPEECPNYVVSWWTPQDGLKKGQPIVVKDCAPKRTLLMIQELMNMNVALQRAEEQQRNESKKVSDLCVETIKRQSEMVAVIRDLATNQIEENKPEVIDYKES